ELVIDRWTNSGFREDSVKLTIKDRVNVPAGEENIHWIEVEYYDYVSSGEIEVILDPFETELDNTWLGEYYSNNNLEGTPYVMGGKNGLSKIKSIAFNWGLKSPYYKIPTDNFSARFTKKADFSAGTYLFSVNGDDGFRVYLDNQLIIDAWPNTGLREKRKTLEVSEGEHEIVVEYFEGAYAANVSFKYEQYNQVETIVGKEVHYNWDKGSPEYGVSSDYFMTSFDQSGMYGRGDYFIQTFADDGIKVEVNEQKVIDRWTDFTGTIDKALWLDVPEGHHEVKTHYFENVGRAAVFSDVVPFDSWLAYYYPNRTLSGMPTAAKVIEKENLHE
ncbi:PA14 domain-containing protein, partial [Salirhabdus euzebyi]|uniref:PA14 domain-containing protein n=1 Tax=Salirhabdus euzebyi TaxID=394506 RepID=UPI001FE6175D